MSFLKQLQNKTEILKSYDPLFSITAEVPFNIYKTNLNGVIDPQDVKTKILDFKQNNPKNHITNVFAWRSSWFLHKQTNCFDNLLTEFTNVAKHFFNYPNISQCQIEVLNLWALTYEKAEYARWHNHGHNTLSMVYYVDINADSAPIEFANANNSVLSVKPNKGDLLVFHGLANHRVPKNPENNSRIVIAANLLFLKNELPH